MARAPEPSRAVPELPEVETVRRDLHGRLTGKKIVSMKISCANLRRLVPASLPGNVAGKTVSGVRRRAKYLIVDFKHGSMCIHLGMSGSLRADLPTDKPRRHDHIEWRTANQTLRYNDPRRFGMVFWTANADRHPLLASCGVEPLTDDFSGEALCAISRNRAVPIKILLMDGKKIAGIGNIYASEALFKAGIHPTATASKLGLARCHRLAAEVKQVLRQAIRAGGSSLRNHAFGAGDKGWFQLSHKVYSRAGCPCQCCGSPISRVVMGQRATYFCPVCQKG